MNNQDIFWECGNENKPIDKLKTGFLTFNNPHYKEEIIYITSDFKEIADKLRNGWRLFPGKTRWVLKAPEISLCDLSDALSNPTNNPRGILAFYRVLNKSNLVDLLHKVKKANDINDLDIIPLKGGSTGTEIRISGSDLRIYQFPKLTYEFVKKSVLWKEEFLRCVKTVKNRRIKIQSFLYNRKTPQICQTFFLYIKKQYHILEQVIKPTEIIAGVWKNIPPCDYYIFVPKAGLKYILGFLKENQKPDKLILWEYHTGIERGKEIVINGKNLQGKHVGIVDRFYSGGTSIYLKNQVKSLGGIPIGIALFPKSNKKITEMNFILFVDKFIKTNDIPHGNKWSEELFIKVIND